MPRPAAEEFYSSEDGAPAQGDILLGAVARVVADDDWPVPNWRALDEVEAQLDGPRGLLPALRVAAGRAVVMVTTHDCGLDKEFNAAVTRLTAAPGADEGAVLASAEADRALDRVFQVSPLLEPATVEVAGQILDQGLLLAGRVVGYLPVPALTDPSGRTLIPESVVDLSYRATIDRFSYTHRVSAISEPARQRLRYALARLDVLRTPTLESELAAAVGQQILGAKVHKRNPLVVTLTLADGTTLELLQPPGSPPLGPVSRSRRSVQVPQEEGPPDQRSSRGCDPPSGAG